MEYTEEGFYKIVGEKIRIARQAANKSQFDLARSVGLNRTSITNMEAGTQKIQVYILYQIAEFLHVPILTLLPQTERYDTDKEKLLSEKKVITAEGEKIDLTESDVENILKVIR